MHVIEVGGTQRMAASAVVLYHVLIQGREAPPYNYAQVHGAEAAAEAAEAAASKSVLATQSIYDTLSHELPTYQVLPNELPEFSNSSFTVAKMWSQRSGPRI